MSRSKINRISKVLRAIADNLDENPDFLKQLEDFVKTKEAAIPGKPKNSNVVSIDIWATHSQDGNNELRRKLEELSVPQLIKIIQENALDPSKLSHKWKTKNKLLSLIMDRVMDRVNKGKIFYEYGKSPDIENEDSEKSDKSDI